VAGILDSKSRVFDFALTPQGKRQLASGKIRFVKATVSDRSSFYEKDPTGGATDATQRVYFETYQRAGDQVTVESDDSGLLLPFPGASQSATDSNASTDRVEFASSGASLSLDSVSNFEGLKALLSDDPNDPDVRSFSITGRSFVFYNSLSTAPRVKKIDQIESVLFDKRLQRKPNFQYLPPLNERGEPLGKYSDFRQQFTDSPDLSLGELVANKRGERQQVFASNFNGDRQKNVLNLQVFETTRDGAVRKLDLIDFGEITQGSQNLRIVFAGRVILNSFQFPTFVNILTLVLK
jgi:hypothetical protein